MRCSTAYDEIFNRTGKAHDSGCFIVRIVQLLARAVPKTGVRKAMTTKELRDGYSGRADRINDVVAGVWFWYRGSFDYLSSKLVDECQAPNILNTPLT